MSNSLHSEILPGFRSLVAPTLFGQLDEDLQQRLLDKAPALRFADGQIIQHSGDEPGGFWVIQHGTVKVGRFRLDGEFRTIALLAQGDSYGELAMFAGTRRAVDSLADGPVALQWISASAFERAIASDLIAMRQLISALSIQLQEMIALIAGLGSGTSQRRVAAVLVNLTSTSAGQHMIALGQQDLAELTGLTRVTVNKCLAELETAGALVRHYRRIEICDRTALRSLAAG